MIILHQIDLCEEFENFDKNTKINMSYSLLDNNSFKDDIYNTSLDKRRISFSRSLEKFSSNSFDFEFFNKTSQKHLKQDYLSFNYGRNLKTFLIEGLRSKSNGSLSVEKINKTIDNPNINPISLVQFIKVKGESGYSMFLLDEFWFLRKYYFKNVSYE